MEKKLIPAVQSFPIIYDKNFTDYRNIVKKEKAWMAVSKIVKEPIELCRSRWKSLRDRFCREVSAYKGIGERSMNKNVSLSNPLDVQPHWKYFEALMFLAEHVTPRYVWKTGGRMRSPKLEQIADEESNGAYAMNAAEQIYDSYDDVYGGYGQMCVTDHTEICPSTSDSTSTTKFQIKKPKRVINADEVEESFLNFLNKMDGIVEGRFSSSQSRHSAFFTMLGEQLDKLPEYEMEEIKMEILMKVHKKNMEFLRASSK